MWQSKLKNTILAKIHKETNSRSSSFLNRFEHIEFLTENHKKLFNVDYYKFFEIESIENHPEISKIQLEEKKVEEEVKLFYLFIHEINDK